VLSACGQHAPLGVGASAAADVNAATGANTKTGAKRIVDAGVSARLMPTLPTG